MEEKMNATQAENQELKRVLRLPTLVCQGLAYLCPACVLMYFGIINQLTGGHFPLALVVAGIAMTLTAMSYAKMCRRYPVAGSVYSYVSKSIGPKLGFLAGWTMMLDYFLLPMTCYLGCGLYLNIMIPMIPVWVWIVLSVLFVGVCNYIGVGVAAFINNINVIAAAVCAYLWLSLTATAKIVGFSWLALGVAFLAVKTKGFRELPPEMNL